MPSGSRGAPVFLAGFGGPTPMVDLHVPYQRPSLYTVSGTTRDSTGATLAGCTVDVIETATGVRRARTVSDAAGAFSVAVTEGLQFRLDAYLAGSPDVAGTTVNTVVGTAQ